MIVVQDHECNMYVGFFFFLFFLNVYFMTHNEGKLVQLFRYAVSQYHTNYTTVIAANDAHLPNVIFFFSNEFLRYIGHIYIYTMSRKMSVES